MAGVHFAEIRGQLDALETETFEVMELNGMSEEILGSSTSSTSTSSTSSSSTSSTSSSSSCA